MKKFFTLIAVALVALSANAKEPITLPEGMGAGVTTNFGSWEWKTIANLYTGEDIDKATAGDANTIYYDASAYDYLVVKYKQCTMATDFGLQYNSKGTVGQWGPEFNVGSAKISANSSGLVGIALDASLKAKVYSIYMQSNAEGSMIIEEVYFASAAEYQADLAANPVVAWFDPVKELKVANATNTWNDATYTTFNKETGEVEIIKANGAQGWWLGNSDNSYYKKLVIELKDVVVSGYFQINIGGSFTDGSYRKIIELPESYNQLMLQGGEGTKFTIVRAYLTTDEYIAENNIKEEIIYGDTQDFSLDNLNGGWGADYDTSKKTISITGEEGGGKGWWIDSGDYSHFDNVVIEFDPAVEADWGKVVVEYADGTTANGEQEFYKGATCVVVPFDASAKGAVKQVYVMGNSGSAYTLKAAYAAVASATPTPNIGTATDINAIFATNAQKNDAIYNLAGQKVNAQYKGVVIKNGRKVMQ